MYREIPTFYSYEVLEYDRKSRSDDPLLSVEEVLERHGKILEEYALKHLNGPLPEENKYKEVDALWDIKLQQFVDRKWKNYPCEIRKQRIYLEPEWDYKILSIKKL